MAAPKVTEYERQRLENIRRREEMMAALNIHAKAHELSAASKRHRVQSKTHEKTAANKKPKPKPRTPIITRQSLRARRNPAEDYTDTRRSLRLSGMRPNYSDAKGLDDLPESDSSSSSSSETRNLGPLRMGDAYKGTGSDRALIEAIVRVLEQTQLRPEAEGGFGDQRFEEPKLGALIEGNDGVPCNLISGVSGNDSLSRAVNNEDDKLVGAFDLESLTLEQENISRIVPGRILVVRFFPTADMKMVMAGNKYGDIGFWDLNSVNKDGDGIYLYHPHSAPVSGISVHPCSLSKIYTSSYDGFIRVMHAEKEVFDLVYFSDDAIFSLSQRPNDTKSIYFSEGHGGLKSLDERAVESSNFWMLHEDRINSINFKADNPNIMATSSSDGTVKIWDLRHIVADKPKALKIYSHKRAVHSANFSPSGRFLATTSLDDNVGLFSGANFEHIDMIHHNNQTGRWLSPFRGIWGWDDLCIFVGNMKRGVDVISSAQKKAITTLQSPNMSAIPCRFDAHPCQVGMLAGATSGGQVYVWTSC